MTSTDRSRLHRDDVLRAALDLLNEVGIDALSTRKLADRLGVQSPTLYWHFKSKAALLDAMSAAVMLESRARFAPERHACWQDWLMADGRSNKEIANDLGISERTVKTHLGHLFDKLGVTSRTEAAKVAAADVGLNHHPPAAVVAADLVLSFRNLDARDRGKGHRHAG